MDKTFQVKSQLLGQAGTAISLDDEFVFEAKLMWVALPWGISMMACLKKETCQG